MDNVTHSLIGVLAAKATEKRWLAVGDKSRMGIWVLTSVLANNAPDLDFIFSFKSKERGLDYLLNHRGFTHTFAIVPVMALFSVLVAVGIMLKNRKQNREIIGGLFKLACLGVCLHIFADSWNNYGVHPFWPFWNGWIYGDSLFIVEPLLWVAILPLLTLPGRARVEKTVGYGLTFFAFALSLSLGLRTGLMSAESITILTLFAGISFLWIRSEARSQSEIRASLGLVLFVLSLFGLAGMKAREHVRAILAAEKPTESVIQLASSPHPSNPFSWWVTSAAVDHAPHAGYYARSGQFQFFASEHSPLVWEREFQGQVEEWVLLKQSNCGFRSYLQFARIPTWETLEKSAVVLVGDLRFEMKGRSSFASMKLTDNMGRSADGSCSRWSWGMPTRIEGE